MNLLLILAYILVGRLMIFLWMSLPIPENFENSRFLHGVHSCDLCCGVYIYSILSWIFQIDLIQLLGLSGFPLINYILTGSIFSFLTHIFIIGWKDKFETIIL